MRFHRSYMRMCTVFDLFTCVSQSRASHQGLTLVCKGFSAGALGFSEAALPSGFGFGGCMACGVWVHCSKKVCCMSFRIPQAELKHSSPHRAWQGLQCSACLAGFMGWTLCLDLTCSCPLSRTQFFTSVWVAVRGCLCAPVCSCASRSCVCIHIYIYIYIYVCVCVFVYTYTYTHTHTHM